MILQCFLAHQKIKSHQQALIRLLYNSAVAYVLGHPVINSPTAQHVHVGVKQATKKSFPETKC